MSEQDYINGSQRAWLTMLGECLRQLGYDSESGRTAAWAKERAETVLKLREVCEDFGSNDWPDNLHLADVIEKHLARYL